MDHFLKFLVVGGLGFVINTLGLIFGVRLGLTPSVAGPIGAEFAVISNFIFNNFWAFSDKKITDLSIIPFVFIKFNILAFGSVIIQFLFLRVGEKIFGLKKFKEPLVNLPFFSHLKIVKFLLKVKLLNGLSKKISTYLIFYLTGVAVGLVVNFIVYSTFIWN